MKTRLLSLVILVAVLTPACFTGCATERAAGVENRQDRVDSRFEGRMERRQIRAEREDARADARWEAWSQ